MRLTRACSRHCSFTGQVAQIRRAISTPTPSLGKNVLGGSWAQLPRAIHSVSMCPPVPACLLIRNRGGFGSRELRVRTNSRRIWEFPERPPSRGCEPPRAHARVVYLGPVAPHWEVQSDFGDRQMIEDFRARVMARLVLLPPHDPQFRRNRERVVRDAERENILLEWDLGYPEDEES